MKKDKENKKMRKNEIKDVRTRKERVKKGRR